MLLPSLEVDEAVGVGAVVVDLRQGKRRYQQV